MKKQLGENCHLLLKLHPAVELSSLNNNDFVTDVSSGYDINALLTVTDILITDYSSIPFEFSILNKPMIFFSYDLDDYKKERGDRKSIVYGKRKDEQKRSHYLD